MQLKLVLFRLLIGINLCSLAAQDIVINKVGSSEKYIQTLQQSKELRYDIILALYDTFIEDHPEDITAKIERCKFIGNSFYDSYEDYNPNYDLMVACIDTLYVQYPDQPEVILYKLDYTWGEERERLLKAVLDAMERTKTSWTYNQQSRLYEMVSDFFSEDNDALAIRYGKQAVRLSDSLDLSVSMAESYLRLGDEEEAREVLLEALYYDSEYAWTFQRKGELLINFNEIEEATRMFERAREKDSTITSNESFYKIFSEMGKYEEARNYLVKDTLNDWDKISSIQKLLNHDISYETYDTAIATYRRMQELDYYDDLLGMKRLRLFFKSPLANWTVNELSHMAVLMLGLMLLLIIPYLWVLPVYAVGKLLNVKIKKPKIAIDWNLKHFWLISFAYLLSQTALILVFFYQDYINIFLETGYDYSTEILEQVNLETARANVFYFVLLLILTAFFLNRKRMAFVWRTTFSLGKIIALTFGFICFNAILIKIVTFLFSAEDLLAAMQFLNAKEDIGMVMTEYGFLLTFLFVALIVPFYEEVIFRGIILTSVEKHLGFIAANLIQAVLFALVHMNFQLFLFYLAFGLILGLMVKKSEGLRVGFIFHAVNNFIVLLSIALLGSV